MEETPKDRKARLQRIRYERYISKPENRIKERERLKSRKKEKGWTWPAYRELGLEIKNLKEITPCKDCKITYPAECMDFDHRPDEKKIFCVGTMVAHGHNREKVYAEIAKCDLICSNCHRIRTRLRKLRENC